MRGIKIRPLHHGNMHADLELLVTGHPDLMLTKTSHAKNKVWCEVPSFTFLIDHPDGRILFDASIHEAAGRHEEAATWYRKALEAGDPDPRRQEDRKSVV